MSPRASAGSAPTASRASRRGARGHAPAPERRAQILEAAFKCFSERGYHAATMDDLVEASGLSKGTLYWHFDGKEAVFVALFDYVAEEIFGRFGAAASSGEGDVVALLERELAHFFERFGGDGRKLILAWTEFLSHPAGRARMADLYRTSRQMLSEIVRLGIERGELRDVSPDGAGAMLTGTLDALVLQAAVDPDFDVREHADALWDLLKHGLAAPTGAAR